MTKMLKTMLAAAVLAVSSMAAQAATVDILRGKTTLVLNTVGLGLEASASGDASTEQGRLGTQFVLGITGGTISEDGARIEHAGSGITLSDGVTSVTVSNFVIDTLSGSIFVDIMGGASNVVALTLGEQHHSGYTPVYVAEALGGLFDGVDEGRKFALGTTTPEVPLPAAGFLLMGGLGGLMLLKRRTKAA